MRRLILPAVLLLFGVIVAGCGSPPPLVSDTYLRDLTLINQQDETCQSPCFQGITPGETTFADALARVRANAAFSNVQSQDNPPQAVWSTQDGTACCNIAADPDTGLVEVILVRMAPLMTAGDVIDRYGEPDYVLPQDYSPEETVLGLLYPDRGLVIWVTPGSAASDFVASSPVVVVLYFNPTTADELIGAATLQGWAGYQPYQVYRDATPVVTPLPTATPAS